MDRKVVQAVLCTLSFVVIDCGGPTVKTEILNGVVQTGIGQYGTYFLRNSRRSVNVSCTTSLLSKDANITLLVNDTESGIRAIESTGAVNQSVFLFRIPSTGIIQLTCRLRISILPYQNRVSFEYVAEDTVELNVWPLSGRPQCVSSIGSTGSEGETTLLTCTTSVDSRETEIRWTGPRGLKEDIQRSNGPVRATIRTLSVSQVVNEQVCQRRKNGQEWMEVCTFPPLTVLRENNIEIRPVQFSPDDVRLTFTCTTTPPDRIEWLVFGNYGDIFNGISSTFMLSGSRFNVKVTQRRGVSTLVISGSSLTLLGIHTVMCTTDERWYFRIAVSQVRDHSISTGVSSVTKFSTTTETVSRNNGPRTGSSVTSIVIIVILSLLVILLGVVSIILYIRTKPAINTSQSGPDIETNGPIQEDSTEYEQYNPEYNAPHPYSELQSGAGDNTYSDPSSDRKHEYEIPKP